jgi:hypothetical protein
MKNVSMGLENSERGDYGAGVETGSLEGAVWTASAIGCCGAGETGSSVAGT